MTTQSKVEAIDIDNMDNLYQNFDVLFAETGNSPQADTKTSKFQEEFAKYSAEEQLLLNKFDLTDTDLSTSEKFELFDEIVTSKDVYSHHKYDIGTIEQKFHIRLKPNAELKKQRPSKVPLHYRDKLTDLLEKLETAGIIKQMGSDVDLEMGSEFINPIIIMPKGDTIKLVLDARYLNSVTDLSTYSWPLEPLTALLSRIRGNFFSTSDLSYAYSQVSLTDETQRLVSFVIGDKQWTFQKGFYGLAGLPNFFSRIMTIHFAPLIKRKAALTYLDDAMLQAETKTEMFQNIKEYHYLLKKAGLKAAPDKTKFFLRKVKFLGHMISGKGISPVAKKVEELKKLKSPENKRDVLKVLGCLNFYSRYIRNLHVNSKPFYELIKDETIFEWTAEHEKLFQRMKDEISADTTLAIPNEKYPFFIHTDASIWGAGAILVQKLPKGKRIVSFNSRVFDKHEQQMSTLYRELAAVIFALQTYEYVIIGSKFPITIFCDHRPILFLWARKGQPNQRFFKYQMTLTNFQNLKIIWTPGKNLPFPDILSRNYTEEEQNRLKLNQKSLPKDITFFDEKGNEVSYLIEHEESQSKEDAFNSHPIICESQDQKVRMRINKLGDDVFTESAHDVKLVNLTNVSHLFSRTGHKSLKNPKLPDQPYIENQPENTSSDDETILVHNPIEVSDNDADDDDRNVPSELCIKMVALAKSSHSLMDSNLSEGIDRVIDIVFARVFTTDVTGQESQWKIFPELTLELIKKEQLKDSVLGPVIFWMKNSFPQKRNPRLGTSRALTSYFTRQNLLKFDPDTGVVLIDEYAMYATRAQEKICLPLSLVITAFAKAHNCKLSGHQGITRTLEIIQRYFYFPGLAAWISALTHDCLNCQKNKNFSVKNNRAPIQDWSITVPHPMHTVHMDFKGPLNPLSNRCQYCLVIIDAYTHFCQVIPVQRADGNSVIKALTDNWILPYGIMQYLVTDRGSEFFNFKIAEWCSVLGITMKPRSGYNPWSNGMCENRMQHLGKYLRAFINENATNWADLASTFAYAVNTQILTHLGKTPYEILFGVKPQVPISLRLGTLRNQQKLCCPKPGSFCENLPPHKHEDESLIAENVRKLIKPNVSADLLQRENDFKQIYTSVYEKNLIAQERDNKYRSKFNVAKMLKVGAQVLVENNTKPTDRSKKLQTRREGPYLIQEVVTPVNYRVQDIANPTKIRVVHRNLLLPYYPKEETLPHLVSKYRIENKMDALPRREIALFEDPEPSWDVDGNQLDNNQDWNFEGNEPADQENDLADFVPPRDKSTPHPNARMNDSGLGESMGDPNQRSPLQRRGADTPQQGFNSRMGNTQRRTPLPTIEGSPPRAGSRRSLFDRMGERMFTNPQNPSTSSNQANASQNPADWETRLGNQRNEKRSGLRNQPRKSYWK